MIRPALFDSELQVISLGVGEFAEALRQQAVPVVELAWQPPAGGEAELVDLLKQTYGNRALVERIDIANRETVRRILDSNPQLIDVAPAGEVMGLSRTILHAGPPIAWARMCGPQKRAVLGAIRFEGWAGDDAAAEALVESGEISLSPCHRYNAVGTMTGIISPSMPVLVVQNETFGNTSYATFNEGRGNTLWFGVADAGTLDRLVWIRDELGPAMQATIAQHGPLNVFDIVAQGLQMGDECHARSAACTALLLKKLAAPMLEAGVPSKTVAAIARFIDNNNHFFLSFTIAAVKATMDAAHGVPYSTVVTAMSRNGVDFMVRIGGLGHRWLIAPVSPMDEAVYYTGYGLEDAAGDIGDSAIIETCGLGGMAIAGAPTIAPFVGGSLSDEIAIVRTFETIALDTHEKFRLPPMDSAHPPLGLDLRKIVETRIVPFITTGVLHESSSTVGQIGTGIARAPIDVFDRALVALAYHWALPVNRPLPEASIIHLAPEGEAS
jgi:hypothetical protein